MDNSLQFHPIPVREILRAILGFSPMNQLVFMGKFQISWIEMESITYQPNLFVNNIEVYNVTDRQVNQYAEE